MKAIWSETDPESGVRFIFNNRSQFDTFSKWAEIAVYRGDETIEAATIWALHRTLVDEHIKGDRVNKTTTEQETRFDELEKIKRKLLG